MSFKKKLFGVPATVLGVSLGVVAGGLAAAKELFQKITSGKYWPAFGFIAAETELTRMR